jgi:hypothetical protein
MTLRTGRVGSQPSSNFVERWQSEILSQSKPSTINAAKSDLRTHILPCWAILVWARWEPKYSRRVAFSTAREFQFQRISVQSRDGAAGPRMLPAPVCDGRRFIKLGLRKNSFRQLRIYWLVGLRRSGQVESFQRPPGWNKKRLPAREISMNSRSPVWPLSALLPMQSLDGGSG